MGLVDGVADGSLLSRRLTKAPTSPARLLQGLVQRGPRWPSLSPHTRCEPWHVYRNLSNGGQPAPRRESDKRLLARPSAEYHAAADNAAAEAFQRHRKGVWEIYLE